MVGVLDVDDVRGAIEPSAAGKNQWGEEDEKCPTEKSHPTGPSFDPITPITVLYVSDKMVWAIRSEVYISYDARALL